MSLASLESFGLGGVFSPLDVHFAEALARLAGEGDPRVHLAAALASRHVGNGHVCVDLRRVSRVPIAGDDGIAIAVDWPEIESWLAALRASPLVAAVGSGRGDDRPLVLDPEGRLYLQRYWQHQERLAAAILARVDASAAVPGPPPNPSLAPTTSRKPGRTPSAQIDLFQTNPAPSQTAPPDWQQIAVVAALEKRFCVISGGPGTGKTYTVVSILARLIERALAAGQPAPRIQLLAPTGKAAARLRESIRENKGSLAISDEVRQAIPEEASTIHRCLGWRRGSRTRFRHDHKDPLLVDVVLVDEASMVDLALMARLADALPEEARLILLGDEDQLASVEAGAVLGDICDSGGARRYSRAFAARVAEVTGTALPLGDEAPPANGIGDCVVKLEHSYRYAADSGIGALARAINEGDAEQALAILASTATDVSLVETSGKTLDPRVLGVAAEGFAAYLAEDDPLRQLALLGEFRLLCALRRGPHGVESVNRAVEAELSRQGLLDTTVGDGYLKRPILVTRNDYQLELFNGDVGVIGSPAEGQRAAWFLTPQGEARLFALSRLPPHETVFAMTVHKSQGSELERIAVVLPPDDSPLLSRELLYTAVSRARKQVTLFASRDVVRSAIGRRIERASGLRDLLWGAKPNP